MVYSLPMLCVLFVFKISFKCVFYSGFASTVCTLPLPGPTTLGAGATVSSFVAAVVSFAAVVGIASTVASFVDLLFAFVVSLELFFLVCD